MRRDRARMDMDARLILIFPQDSVCRSPDFPTYFPAAPVEKTENGGIVLP